MPTARTIGLTALAMLAFAGNSLLCRAALRHTAIDPASFTTVRLVSGALMLWLLVRLRGGVRSAGGPSTMLGVAASQSRGGGGSWLSAGALFAYAAGFSFAYVTLPAAAGALLLFGAVQATMIGYGLARGERLHGVQWLGVALAVGGLVGLLLPGLTSPPLGGALLMLGAGAAWGVYSLRGRGGSNPTLLRSRMRSYEGQAPDLSPISERGRNNGDPTAVTAGNFLRAAPITLALTVLMWPMARVDTAGLAYAVASGALASGVGYAIWYAALPGLRAASAATVQLSVPVIAAAGGVVLLGEPMTARLALASAAILGGIALVVVEKRGQPHP